MARQYLKGAGKFSMRLLGLLGLVWGSGAMAADPVRVIMQTTQGAITLELDAKAAPATVANFLSYVEQSGYDNTIFHRVIEGFMIQGGGYYRDLSESPSGPSLRNEADNGLRNEVGTIAMARMAEIDSATNQFFINVADNRRLDHQGDSCSREEEAAAEARAERGLFKPKRCKSFGYAVFGRVIDGMSVISIPAGRVGLINFVYNKDSFPKCPTVSDRSVALRPTPCPQCGSRSACWSRSPWSLDGCSAGTQTTTWQTGD